MPKIIRFSSPLCTLFHKSISHYLQHKIYKKTSNSKQQAHTTFNRQIHSKKSHVQSHNYVIKILSSKPHQNFTKMSTKKWAKTRIYPTHFGDEFLHVITS